MKLGNLGLTFHRTVRVADGREPSNLPPSLGRMELYRVDKYVDKCPANWEKEGFFAALHETEAMWMSFACPHPVALLVGAGGINALSGEKLGTALEKDNYLVTPPQPWLDGWKDKDGTVYQFVATAYEKGKGITVAEQLIGEQSKTGAIGIAVFDPKEAANLKPKRTPPEGYSGSAKDDNFSWNPDGGSLPQAMASTHSTPRVATAASRSLRPSGISLDSARHEHFSEMGIGKGGKVIQKIYADPHGLEVWQEKPSATLAIYLVNAAVFEEITGIKVPAPIGHENYGGKWFGMKDQQEQDIGGSDKFTGLKSAVFPASSLQPEQAEASQPTTEEVGK